MADDVDLSVSARPDAYYTGETYWNTFPEAVPILNERATGDPTRDWDDHFPTVVDGRVFERALVLNCGNGRVERELLRKGVVREAVGIDVLDALLDEARAQAAAESLPLDYHQMDVNSVAFPDGPFDLVVNVAAAHHIRFIDRVFRALADLLPETGWFVSYDYVGPHRNQYDHDAWEAVWQLQRTLPGDLQRVVRYPHLPTSIADDPTEAIHSELILETFARYFDVRHRVDLGGALAYPLLAGADALLAAPAEVRGAHVQRIFAADAEWLAAHPGRTLFSYFAGQPRKEVLTETAALAEWTAAEEARETAAEANGGEYYPHTALQDATLELSEHEIAARHRAATLAEWGGIIDGLRARVAALEAEAASATTALAEVTAERDALAAHPALRGYRAVRTSRPVARLLASRPARRLRHRG